MYSFEQSIHIIKENKCICGGNINYENGKCLKCGMVNERLQIEYSKLKDYLKNNDTSLDLKTINLFILLLENDFNDEEMNFIIKQQKIKKKLNDFIVKINNLVEKAISLTNDENKILSIILNSRLKNNIDYNQIIKNHLINKKIVSIDTFEEVIKIFISGFLDILNDHSLDNYQGKCFILDGVVSAIDTNNYNVYLNKKCIDAIYNGKINYIQIIFNEIYNMQQLVLMKKGIFNSSIVLYIKSQIIKKVVDNKYYEDDILSSYQLHSKINSYIYTFRFFKELNLKLADEKYNKINNLIDAELENNKIEISKYKDEEDLSFDDMYDLYIKYHPEYLDEYPQLNIDYVKQNNLVRRKNKMELVNTCLTIDDKIINEYLYKKIKKMNKEENKKYLNT